MAQIKCYDTLSGEYVIVEVTPELETFIKRSYWREDMQERRYQARKLLFEDTYRYGECDDVILNKVVKDIQLSFLRERLASLDKRARKLMYYRYYRAMNLEQIGKILDISPSYAAKLLKRIQAELRSELEAVDLLY